MKPNKVDVEVLVASNRDLEDELRAGNFRPDPCHRLSVFRLQLPALRERLDYLNELVPNRVAEFNTIAGRRVEHTPDSIYQRMPVYRCPGNVRELRNVVERCVLLAASEVFPERCLQLGEGLQRPEHDPEVEGDRVTIPLDGSMALDEMDSFIIPTALKRNDDNVTATALAFGTTRETLRYGIQKTHLNLRAHKGSRTEGERIEAV